MKRVIIVADASPLIALAKLNQLSLLNTLFTEVHVPETVLLEVSADHTRNDARLLVEFLNKHAHKHTDENNDFCQRLRRSLDEGEIQALSLARQLSCGVLMDELRGRKVATHYQIPVVGVLGVLIQAKQQGLIDAAAPLIDKLQQENYRLSPALIETVLKRLGETN